MNEIYICDDGTKLLTKPGNKSKNDFIIFTKFPQPTHPHLLEYIGQALRLKGEVEDINYPIEHGYQGHKYLIRFIRECIENKEKTVKEICNEFRIPTRDNGNKIEICKICGLPKIIHFKNVEFCQEFFVIKI